MDLHVVHKRKPVWNENKARPSQNPVRIESFRTAIPKELQIFKYLHFSHLHPLLSNAIFNCVHTEIIHIYFLH